MKKYGLEPLKQIINYYETDIEPCMNCENEFEAGVIEKWIANKHLSVEVGEAIVNSSIIDARTVANVILTLCDAHDKDLTNRHEKDRNAYILKSLHSIVDNMNVLCNEFGITDNAKVAHDANGTVIKKFE